MKTLLKACLPALITTGLGSAYLFTMNWGPNWPGEPIGFSFVVLVAALLNFVPTSLAAYRQCPNYVGFLVLNTVVPGFGWMLSLIWAMVDKKPRQSQEVI